MDFDENNNNYTGTSEPQSSEPIYGAAQAAMPAAKPPKKRTGWKIFWGIFIGLSVLANFVLLAMLVLVGIAAAFGAGYKDALVEEVIISGPRTTKIAVITLQGVIDGEKAQELYSQLKSARQDKRVKGLIIRVDSPGGTISASDQIYNEILKYRHKTDKPVVAFMQGVAASGGYYTSVACDKIVAEPTVITGSIGVIMGHFVFQELFEDKLGIQPVIFKSGPKKDWPSPFQPTTEEQRQYIQDKLINPAYERFVQIVAEGRPSLTLTDVKRLADGSIYGAQEALDEKLIDEIGYIDEAIKLVLSMAKIEKAEVVEYRKPFSLSGFLSSRSRNALKIDRTTLYELSTPQLLYLWNMCQ